MLTELNFDMWKEEFHERYFGEERFNKLKRTGKGSCVESLCRGSRRMKTIPGLSDDANRYQPLGFLQAYKESALDLAAASPELSTLVKQIIHEYDRIVNKQQSELDTASVSVLSETIKSLQKKLQKTEDEKKKLLTYNDSLLEFNKRLSSLNKGLQVEKHALERQVSILQQEVFSACHNLFIMNKDDAPEGSSSDFGSSKSLDDQINAALRPDPMFISYLRRLSVEIVTLRAQYKESLLRIQDHMTDYNGQQQESNVSLSRCNELAQIVSNYKELLGSANQNIQKLNEDNKRYECEAVQYRIDKTENYWYRQLTERVIKPELEQLRELVTYYVDKRENNTRPPEKMPNFFMSRGTGPDVPPYYVCKSAKVKNKHFPKITVLQHIKDFFTEREVEIEDVSKWNNERSVQQAFSDYCKRFRGGSEFAYSILYCCDRWKTTNIDCQLLLKVLEGDSSEQLIIQVNRTIKNIIAEATQLDKDTKKTSRQAHKLPMDVIVAIIKSHVGDDSAVFHSRLLYVMLLEKTSDDIDIDLTIYPKLCETIKSAIVFASLSAWQSISSACHQLVAGSPDGKLSMFEIRNLILSNATPYVIPAYVVDDVLSAVWVHENPTASFDIYESINANHFTKKLLTTKFIPYNRKNIANST